jgi:hypothetical protein
MDLTLSPETVVHLWSYTGCIRYFCIREGWESCIITRSGHHHDCRTTPILRQKHSLHLINGQNSSQHTTLFLVIVLVLPSLLSLIHRYLSYMSFFSVIL